MRQTVKSERAASRDGEPWQARVIDPLPPPLIRDHRGDAVTLVARSDQPHAGAARERCAWLSEAMARTIYGDGRESPLSVEIGARLIAGARNSIADLWCSL